MTRAIDATTKAQFDSGKPRTFMLFSFELTSGTLYLTDCDRNIVYDGNTYLSFPISIGEIKYTTDGIVESIEIGTSNVKRTFAQLMLGESFRGKSVVVHRGVFGADGYAVTTPFEVFRGLMDEVGGTEGTDNANVAIRVTTELAYWQMGVPGRPYQGPCAWREFKGTECGYAGAETVCDRSWNRCKALDNRQRYGGFRHLSGIENATIYWGRVKE